VSRTGVNPGHMPQLGNASKPLEVLGVDQGFKALREVDVLPDRVADSFSPVFEPHPNAGIDRFHMCLLALRFDGIPLYPSRSPRKGWRLLSRMVSSATLAILTV